MSSELDGRREQLQVSAGQWRMMLEQARTLVESGLLPQRIKN